MTDMGALHRLIPRLAMGTAVLAFLLVVMWAFPIDMDELLPYHPIACLSEAQQLNIYTSACGAYPTSLGPIDFQRAFNYIGAIPALVMLPVFSFSTWVDWHLIAGVLALIVSGFGIAVSLGARKAFALVAVAWLPLALATIHDTGPIRYSLVALTWTPVLLHRFTVDPRRWIRALSLIGLVGFWVLSTESKPYFLYITPGIVLWSVAALEIRQRGFVRLHRMKLALAFGVAGIASLLLLIVLTVDGRPYLAYLADFGSPNSFTQVAGLGLVFLGLWPATAQRFSYQYPNVDSMFPDFLQGPANVLPLSSDRGAPLSLVLLALSIIAVAVLLLWAVRRLLTDRGTRSQLWWLAAAAFALYLGAVASRGGSVHHFAFAQVPLVAVVILAAGRAGCSAIRATGTVLAVSAISLIAILSVPMKPEVSRDIDIVMSEAIARAGSNDIINCQSWGCYYRYALENRQEIPIVWAETAAQAADLSARVSAGGGSILQVCRGCDAAAVAAAFPNSSVVPLVATQDGWALFSVNSQ